MGGEDPDRALRAVALQFWINGLVAASWLPRLPELRDALAVDLTAIGLAMSLASGGGLLASAVVGRLLPRLGSRRLMLLGGAALGGLLPWVAVAPHWWALAAVLAALAFVDVLVDVAMNIQGSRLGQRRAVPVMNRLHGMWSLGTVVGGGAAAAMAALAVPLGWHLFGAAVVVWATLAWVGPRLLDDDQLPAATATASGEGSGGQWVWVLLGACAVSPEVVDMDWSALRLHDDLGLDEGVAGLGFVAFTTGMVLGRFGGDALLLRLGARRLLERALLGCALGALLAFALPLWPLALAGFALAGLGCSVLFPLLYDRAARERGGAGAALGALSAGSRLAMLSMPLMVGALADQFGAVGAAALAAISPALAGLWWVQRRALGAAGGS